MFQDIKRICQSPTEEDKYWFPDIAGSDWLETLHFAMRDFKDESFISQFMSPKIMRDFRFFTVLDDDRNNYLEIAAIHNEEGYREIRSKLSSQYNLSNLEPNIQVWNVDLRGDRSLTLRYIPHNRARWIKAAGKCSNMCIGCGGLMCCWNSKTKMAVWSCWTAALPAAIRLIAKAPPPEGLRFA
jgi:spore cortex formation protein SpoVR/YcgB (stage V sporulation)